MKTRTKIALASAAVFGSVFALSVAVINRKMTALAINREVSPIYNAAYDFIAEKLITAEYLETMRRNSDSLAAISTEEVSISNRDGLKLVGHYYPASDEKRIIIAMHGWRSSWTFDFGAISKFWQDEGCSVLYVEQRGQNGSDGEHMGFGVLERYDCLDWLNYITERFGTRLPIYLSGVSMGATTVLMSSGLGLPCCVHGIIADCGFTSPHAIWTHIMHNDLHVTEKLTYPVAKRICNAEAHFDSDEVSTVDAMKVNTVPILFIHGLDDNFVPVLMTVENYAVCAAAKDLFIVPGAGHGVSCLKDPDGYKKALHDFFTKYD